MLTKRLGPCKLIKRVDWNGLGCWVCSSSGLTRSTPIDPSNVWSVCLFFKVTSIVLILLTKHTGLLITNVGFRAGTECGIIKNRRRFQNSNEAGVGCLSIWHIHCQTRPTEESSGNLHHRNSFILGQCWYLDLWFGDRGVGIGAGRFWRDRWNSFHAWEGSPEVLWSHGERTGGSPEALWSHGERTVVPTLLNSFYKTRSSSGKKGQIWSPEECVLKQNTSAELISHLFKSNLALLWPMRAGARGLPGWQGTGVMLLCGSSQHAQYRLHKSELWDTCVLRLEPM